MAREESRRSDPLRKEMLEKARESFRNASLASVQAPDNGAGAGSDSQLSSSTGQPDQTPDNEPGVGNQENSPEAEEIIEEWPEEQLDSMDKEESSKFRKIKDQFSELESPTPEDRILYEQARNAEIIRKKQRLRRKRREALSEDEGELFVAPDAESEQETLEDEQDEQDPQCHDQDERDLISALAGDESAVAPKKKQRKPRAPTKRKRQNRFPTAERRRGMQLAMARKVTNSKNKTSRRNLKRKANQADPESASESDSNGDSKRRKNSKKRRRNRRVPEQVNFDLDSLLTFNVVETAHANASLPAIPTFTEKNKEKALTQLIASIPASDQAEAKTDKRVVIEATRKFTSSAKSDGQGGWKKNGMKTSLYHYQLLGATFMRDRENSEQRPHGGMLCDVMGFGKTIQVLDVANIVDGRPLDPEDPVKTTLIVVLAHLVNHWRKQMRSHCQPSALGRILEWHARSKFQSSDLVGFLQDQDIIITTYEEVRQSYPQFKPPTELTDALQIQKWWEDEYENGTGPLHKIRFHRIVLDEGHVIKNPDSKVSRAVRALSGRYKWIVSGTPIHNYIEEFCPHFDFLRVPHTGRYDNFVNNFTKGSKAQERLVNVVKSILYRRTHGSRMFSSPVLKLPVPDKELTELLIFCDAEKLIYDTIFNAF
ncbi:SNF2 family domain protein [Aspergillus sclerotialis]|uniref:SNF2 family domain protein n=1 Tax=Aspergillus sclerotialis TaxID=2070753 RepID=A0A3A2ZVE3_9EURO|nr:SNF2 family domain protein [Aspergillus sclerotialis]